MYKPTLLQFKILFTILSWFLFSGLLSIINKLLFGNDHNHFSYPLLTSAFHATLHFILSSIWIYWPFRKNNEQETEQFEPVKFSSWEYWSKVAPCGLSGGIEISTCNAALMFVKLSFYTVIKSSVPIWVLLFSFLLKLEVLTKHLILIILMISIGVALASINELDFNVLGFVLILIGSITSGLKWCLTQLLLTSDTLGLTNPIVTLNRVTPVMALFMLLISLFTEDWNQAFHSLFSKGPTSSIYPSWSLVVAGGILAFVMTLSEFMLIQLTSTLTMSICGISKEVLMISISVFLFKDKLTLINYLGLIISIAGIGWYNYYKLTTSTNLYTEILPSSTLPESTNLSPSLYPPPLSPTTQNLSPV